MRGKWVLFGGITILAAIAAGALSVHYRNALPKLSQHAAPAQPSVPAPVAEVSLVGQIQPQHVVNVPAPIDGTVESYGAEIGQDVFEGQLIAHIQNTKLDAVVEGANLEFERVRARVQQIEAAITSARLEASRAGADASRSKSEFDRANKFYERQQMLYREGATPRLVFEKAEREYKAAKEDLDTKQRVSEQSDERVDTLNRELDAAKRALDERQEALDQAKAEVASGDVRAPVDGLVLSRRGQPGEEVNRTMEDLFTIAVTLTSLEVAVQPEPAVVQRIKAGQPAAIHLAEAPEEIAGTVREIKDGRVIIDFTSPTPAIRPGMTAQVRLKLS